LFAIQEGGFLYDSDSWAEELPYYVMAEGRFQLVVPYTLMRLLGHPSRACGLARFLGYVKTKPDVWVCRRLDLAKHWLAQHPCEVT
jgi:allantoinase